MSEINMLDAKQERENNRDIKLEEYLIAKKKEYESYAPFNKVVGLFFGNIARIDPLIPVKGKKGVTITKQKTELQIKLAANVNEVCLAATEYALSIGDKDLQYAVRFRTSNITNAKDGNITGIVAVITDALTPLLELPAFQEYQITADRLAALTDGANAFSDTRGKAAVVNTDSSLANDNLNKVFKDIRANIASLRRLLVHFNKTAPDFVKGFHTAAAVDYTGIRHSGIEGLIINTNTGAPIEGAIITGEGKNKIAKTDKNGYYKLSKLKVKDMKITIAAPGYQPLVMDVKIIRSRIIELNAGLQAQAVNMSATA